MSPRSHLDYDESDVRVRPGRRGSRPRTKDRPAHEDAVLGTVVGAPLLVTRRALAHRGASAPTMIFESSFRGDRYYYTVQVDRRSAATARTRQDVRGHSPPSGRSPAARTR